jgi:cytochrome P450
MSSTTWNPRAARARRNERRLYLAAQPAGWLLAQVARRRRREIMRVPGLGYVVSGAALGRAVMLDPETYSKTGSASVGEIMTRIMGPYGLVNMDGPAHKELRRKLQGLFTPAYVASIVDGVLGPMIAELRADLDAGREVELAAFAQRLAGTMMCHMTGMQLQGAELDARALEMYRLTIELTSLVPLRISSFPDSKVEQGRAIFGQLLEGTEESFRSGSAETIPGRLRELGLTLEEARGVIGFLMLAGTETTATALVRITALLCDTGQWARLRHDPALLDNAIDEGMRVATPLAAMTRTTERDHVVQGVKVKANRLLLVFLTNACRDPRVIERGADFDISRPTPRELRQLWFGAGTHFCLGFNLARRELAMVFQAIMSLDRDIEVVSRAASRTALLPTYRSLVVRQSP